MRYFIIVLILFLAACNSMQPISISSPCPSPVVPAEPHYPIKDLKQGDNQATVAKAYAASFQLAYDYIHAQLLPILKAYQ